MIQLLFLCSWALLAFCLVITLDWFIDWLVLSSRLNFRTSHLEQLLRKSENLKEKLNEAPTDPKENAVWDQKTHGVPIYHLSDSDWETDENKKREIRPEVSYRSPFQKDKKGYRIPEQRPQIPNQVQKDSEKKSIQEQTETQITKFIRDESDYITPDHRSDKEYP